MRFLTSLCLCLYVTCTLASISWSRIASESISQPRISTLLTTHDVISQASVARTDMTTAAAAAAAAAAAGVVLSEVPLTVRKLSATAKRSTTTTTPSTPPTQSHADPHHHLHHAHDQPHQPTQHAYQHHTTYDYSEQYQQSTSTSDYAAEQHVYDTSSSSSSSSYPPIDHHIPSIEVMESSSSSSSSSLPSSSAAEAAEEQPTWLFRVQKLSPSTLSTLLQPAHVIPDVQTRLTPPLPSHDSPAASGVTEDGLHTARSWLGLRVEYDSPEHSLILTGTIVQYHLLSGQHLFVSDQQQHFLWLNILPRTQQQYDFQQEQLAITKQQQAYSNEVLPEILSKDITVQASIRIATIQAPFTDDIRLASFSHAFFVWLALPTSSFFVNLNPSQPRLILAEDMARTPTGHALLKADLQLKKATAMVLHPDTDKGWEYWEQLNIPFPTPELCLNFRTWIVPSSDIEILEDENYLYLTSASLSVEEESDMGHVNDLFNSGSATAGCSTSDPVLQERAEKLFKQQALPRLKQAVAQEEAFESLRYIFVWRVIAEWYKRQGNDYLLSLGLDASQIPREKWEIFNVEYTRNFLFSTFQEYLNTIQNGVYHLRKLHVVDDKTFARTYAQGAMDWSQISMDVRRTHHLQVSDHSDRIEQTQFYSFILN